MRAGHETERPLGIPTETLPPIPISDAQRVAYTRAIQALAGAGIEFLVGGGFAMHQYLRRWRSTKDLDVFIRRRDVAAALDALGEAGFRVELTDPAWLAKAFADNILIDLIFSSYNRLFPVDDAWFENRRPADVLGLPVALVGPEEMIVSKAFVAARDRFDGSDISWLIRTLGPTLDWGRIEALMADHWEVLLWQLIHYRYVFPEERDRVPRGLVARLLSRSFDDLTEAPPEGTSCRGPMFDAIHYLAAALEKERHDEAAEGAAIFLEPGEPH